MFEVEITEPLSERAPMPISDLDRILTTQFVVAWAGEGGEEKRLDWWRSDLVSEFGGEDLFKRLIPSTWQWAVLQGAREAARREDANLRRRDHNPDRILSLFNLSFEVDELLEERLHDLKRSRSSPQEALPGLHEGIESVWNPSHFSDWILGHGDTETVAVPIGRRIKGDPPASLELAVRRLVAGLLPLADAYPLPHYFQRDS